MRKMTWFKVSIAAGALALVAVVALPLRAQAEKPGAYGEAKAECSSLEKAACGAEKKAACSVKKAACGSEKRAACAKKAACGGEKKAACRAEKAE